MERGLILFWHGIGDVINFTPCLRYLYQRRGIKVDLIGKTSLVESHLLDRCPYVGDIFGISPVSKAERLFEEQKADYDYQIYPKKLIGPLLKTEGSRMKCYGRMIGLAISDWSLDVFISKQAELQAKEYIEKNYPDGFIFNHTMIRAHPMHNWDSRKWIKDNLPDLPVIDTGLGGSHCMLFDDINVSFVLAREAKHRVLSSSVMVHACDALNVDIDAINYGAVTRRMWPLDMSKVKAIRVCGKWEVLRNCEAEEIL